jgi:hypothetical protein
MWRQEVFPRVQKPNVLLFRNFFLLAVATAFLCPKSDTCINYLTGLFRLDQFSRLLFFGSFEHLFSHKNYKIDMIYKLAFVLKQCLSTFFTRGTFPYFKNNLAAPLAVI